MIKRLIKDISEADLRKLNIKVYRHQTIENGERRFTTKMVEHCLNDILDKEIKFELDSGWPYNHKELSMPVYIAIHEKNDDEFSGYWDKFMNSFTGLQTFQIGWGIPHLYSTRDYYEAHDDYWRVAKKETAVIYRVQLDSKWLSKFVLKHKKEIEKRISDNEYIETTYDLNEDGVWVKGRSCRIIKDRHYTNILPVEIE